MSWKESKSFTKDLGPMNPNLPEPVKISDPCVVKVCNAINCKENSFAKNGERKCTLPFVSIGPKAQCLNYSEGDELFQEGLP